VSVDLDTRARQKLAAARAAAPPATAQAKPSTVKGATAKASSPARSGDARDRATCRFTTLNSFTDSAGRYVPSIAREVWHIIFRFADAGTNEAELRVPDIAARLDCDDRTAERGLKVLMATGLITRLRRGTRQSGPSRYFIDPNPSRHIDKLKAIHEQKTDKKVPRMGRPIPSTGRAKGGQFTTRQR